MTHEISNSDDVIDSRDVIARIEELQGERAELEEATQGDHSSDDALSAALDAWDEESGAELATLLNFMEQMKGRGGDEQWRGDWYPVTIIRDSYFTEYAEELCNDICAIPDGFPNYIEIDWEATARNILVDYTSVKFDGATYWVR